MSMGLTLVARNRSSTIKIVLVKSDEPFFRISNVSLRNYDDTCREKSNGTGEYSTMSVTWAEKLGYAVILTSAAGFLLAS